MQHLDAVTVLDRGRGPLRAKHDVTVPRNRYPLSGQLHLFDQVIHRPSVTDVLLRSIDYDGHCTTSATRANRPGVNGCISAGREPSVIRAAMASAVIGVSSIPLR
jgi:hypothetical protein